MSTPILETYQTKAFKLSGSTLVGHETAIGPPGAPAPPPPAAVARARLGHGVEHYAHVFLDRIEFLEAYSLVDYDHEGGRPDLHPGDARTPTQESFTLTPDTARDHYRIELSFARRLTAAERAAIVGTLVEIVTQNPFDALQPATGQRSLFPLHEEDWRTLVTLFPDAPPGWTRLAPWNDPAGVGVTYRSEAEDGDRGPTFLHRQLGEGVAVHRTISISIHEVDAAAAEQVARAIEAATPLESDGGKISLGGRPAILETHGQERKATVPGFRARFLLAGKVHVTVSLGASLDHEPLLAFLAGWDLTRAEAVFEVAQPRNA